MYKEAMEKIALNKAMKVIRNLGNGKGQNFKPLGMDTQQKIGDLFERSAPAVNNINNRINAKAKRLMEGGQVPKKISAKGYKNLSKVDNLGNSPVLNSGRRQLKFMGRENRENINAARKFMGKEVPKPQRDSNFLNSGVHFSFNGKNPGSIDDYAIDKMIIPGGSHTPQKGNPLAFLTGKGNMAEKEVRGLTANHEMSGEMPEIIKQLEFAKKTGAKPGAFEFNGHINPMVRSRDIRNAQRVSPRGRNIFQSSTNVEHGSESELAKMLGGSRLGTGRSQDATLDSMRKFTGDVNPLPNNGRNAVANMRPLTRGEEANAMRNAYAINNNFEPIPKNIEDGIDGLTKWRLPGTEHMPRRSGSSKGTNFAQFDDWNNRREAALQSDEYQKQLEELQKRFLNSQGVRN